MTQAPTLVGSLGSHARGRTLALSIGAKAGELPTSGVVLAFAKDFQENAVRGAEVLAWVERPGRLLVLVPPFGKGPTAVPVEWEARRTEPLAGGDTKLAALLARERQHELRGALLSLERSGGQMVTGGWRRHPAAGLLVITTLPLWSLHTLDHRDLVREWLEVQLASAGDPLPEETAAPSAAQLEARDWAILLHLCRGPFASAEAAVAALVESAVHRVEAADPRAVLCALERRGLADGGRLTDVGVQLLDESPYAAYAQAFRSAAHG